MTLRWAPFLLVFVAGCASSHEADFSRAIAAEGFEWNGSVRIDCAGLFASPQVDRITLGARGGRSVIIVVEGARVRAYMEVKVTSTQPAVSTRPTEDMTPLEPDAHE